MRQGKVWFLAFVAGLLLTSCAGLKPPKVDENSITSAKSSTTGLDVKALLNRKVTPLKIPASVKVSSPPFFSLRPEVAGKRVDVEVNDTPLDEVLLAVSFQTGVPVVCSGNCTEKVSALYWHGTLGEVLRYLASKYDLWVYEENGVVKVSPEAVTHVWIPLFLTNQQGEVKAEDLSVKVKPQDLVEVFKQAAHNVGVRLVAFSDASGCIEVAGSPSKTKRFVQFVKQEVERASRFVVVKVLVLQLTLSHEHQLDFSLTKVWKGSLETLLGQRQVMSVGITGASGQETNDVVFKFKNADTLSLFFQYLNRYGKMEVLSAPVIMTASGVPAEFAITKEIGWWEPGDLVETYGVAGDQTSRLRQEKPEWKKEKVGLQLVVRPRVVDNGTVMMDFFFKDSDVYSESSTDWYAYPGVPPIKLTKPLVLEKKILNRVVLKSGEHLVVAGLRSAQANSKLYTSGKSKSTSDSYLFVVLSPEL